MRASLAFSARRLLDSPREQFDWALFLVPRRSRSSAS